MTTILYATAARLLLPPSSPSPRQENQGFLQPSPQEQEQQPQQPQQKQHQKQQQQQQQQPQQQQQQQQQPWTAPFRPERLSKDQQLPTRGQIAAIIPKKCFQRSYVKSSSFLLRDLVMVGSFLYVSTLVLSPTPPTLTSHEHGGGILAMALWVVSWLGYAVGMGTLLFGPWILAHECGHGAFSDSQILNDVVGFVLHQAMLVPYFSWQYSHGKHHQRSNHMTRNETHLPKLPPSWNDSTKIRFPFSVALNEALENAPFILRQIVTRLSVGWQAYLLGLVSTGEYAYNGTPLKGRIADHFRWNSPLFPPKLAFKVFVSTVTELAVLGVLFYCQYQYGVLPVVLWYWNPYLVVHMWLTVYSWLHHTDPTVPHFGDEDWTWMKGTLATIDRDYGIFDVLHHKIGSTHIVHHLFHDLPFYHADEATAAVKAYLEPMGLYNFDPTPWWKAVWKNGRGCHYVDGREGTQYYRSVIDLPRNGRFKFKAT